MHDNVLSITDTSLDAARSVGLCSGGASLRVNEEFIIMFFSRQQCPLKSISRFKSLSSGNGHAGLGQVSLELVKHGCTKSCRDIPGDACHNTTNGVACLADLVDTLQHLLRRGLVGTTDNVRIDIFHGESIIINIAANFLHLRNVCEHLNAVVHIQNLACNGTSCASANSLTRGGTSASSNRTYAILGIIGGIRMAWSVGNVHVVVKVVSTALILVADEHSNGRAQSDALGVQAR
mmetsp:Transcript_34339/g.72321  ORF Transcript_34339/g.72321 Transcript_34339/m.72321 type:complete len:235 (-) Transcript_34339:354-1058(-)